MYFWIYSLLYNESATKANENMSVSHGHNYKLHFTGRKTYPPIDKNANLAFINMEGGQGGVRPGSQPQVPQVPVVKPVNVPVNLPPTVKPAVVTTSKPATPTATVPKLPTPQVPNYPTPPPSQSKPQTPNQIKPVPVNPAPVATPVSTPGPGSVKQLVNFYDSQGKASPIRPYSYSQAVKQG